MPSTFKRIILFLCLLIAMGPIQAEKIKNQLNSKESLKLKWKIRVGHTSYRTSIQHADSKLFVPSNGKGYQNQFDTYDGVHVIDAKKGDLITQLKLGKYGDRDVNGVAISSSKIVFGTDEHYLGAYDWDWNLKWVVQAGGDFEGAPVLTNMNGGIELDVVAATEAGEVMALDGDTGDLIWRFSTSYNEGKMYSSEKGFMSSPIALDINNDDVRDIVISARNGVIYALNGKDGAVLWKKNSWHPSGYLSSGVAKDERLYFLESHGYLQFHNLKGRLIQRIPLYVRQGPSMVASPVLQPGTLGITIGSAFEAKRSGVVNYQSSKKLDFDEVGTVSATTVIANINQDEAFEQVILTEEGELLVYNQSGTLIGRYSLPAGGEASPLIADVDNDGKLELLVALDNQFLYCYDLKSSGPVYWSQFRANPYNTGVLNDTLLEDKGSDEFVANHSIFKQQENNMGFRYDDWYSAKVDPYLISEKGIGRARIGLSLGQFKLIMKDEDVSLKTFEFEDNLQVIGVVIDKEVHYYLAFSSQRDITDHSKIQRIMTNNPRYYSKSGIRPGTKIADIEKEFGYATLFWNESFPNKENIRFMSQEPWMLFNNYSSVLAGNYKAKNGFQQTGRYNPGAKVLFIGVK